VQQGVELDALTTEGATAYALSLQAGHQQVTRLLAAAAHSRSMVTQVGACAACGANSSAGAAFKKCARCKAVRYCSKDCQRTHWPVHKASCAAS
jgi:hypothetical protein